MKTTALLRTFVTRHASLTETLRDPLDRLPELQENLTSLAPLPYRVTWHD